MQRTQIEIEKAGRGRVKVTGRHVEDARPALQEAAQGREAEAAGLRKGAEYYRVASIPFTLAMRIKAEDGVDPLNLRTPAETRQYLQILQTKYPQFLTTNKKVWRPR
jgi:hypothetical protein